MYDDYCDCVSICLLPLYWVADRYEAGLRIKFRSCSRPFPLACSLRQGNTRLFDLNVAEDDDRIKDAVRRCKVGQAPGAGGPESNRCVWGAVVILKDIDAIPYYNFYCLLSGPHADLPSQLSIFPAVTTAPFAIANSIYHP